MTEAGGARRAERVQVDAFVKIAGDDGQELVFRTRDLSEHGLFLYTKVARVYPFKVGSTLALELYDYDEAVRCEVVVVRVVEPRSAESERFPTGFGVKIVSCSEPGRRVLAAMIARVKAEGDLT
jgi:hypothetical protein